MPLARANWRAVVNVRTSRVAALETSVEDSISAGRCHRLSTRACEGSSPGGRARVCSMTRRGSSSESAAGRPVGHGLGREASEDEGEGDRCGGCRSSGELQNIESGRATRGCGLPEVKCWEVGSRQLSCCATAVQVQSSPVQWLQWRCSVEQDLTPRRVDLRLAFQARVHLPIRNGLRQCTDTGRTGGVATEGGGGPTGPL
jgi:hypothetical protein